VSVPAKIRKLDTFEKDIISFIVEWISGKESFDLKTSGSTGQPKIITIHRDQMIASAEKTLKYLKITSRGKALLCLHPNYIAGLMMIVRSIVGKMDLYVLSPSSNPLKRDDILFEFDIASFVPYQVSEIISDAQSRSYFKGIKNVLIGGADISADLINKISSYENNIYQTFGMTETVSHIGLKRLSGKAKSDFYEVLEGIEIDTDDRDCLTVKGSITGNKRIVTNDQVELLDSHRFHWKGRIDQVINTGGITIYIDDLETRIQDILSENDISNSFFVAGMDDSKLGEKIILFVEKSNKAIIEEDILAVLRKYLQKYEIPKKIYIVQQFILLPTGKINRKANLERLVF
jgi:O-succinylbenzoic acid--CoA ligase